MRKILIFGAKGQLGHDLVLALSAGNDVSGVGREVDITDAAAVGGCVSNVQPDIVINSAAYNKVEDAESSAQIAYSANALGPHNIARACNAQGVPLLHVSTDYVFDGEYERGFSEEDPVRPINVYGASKEAGERLVRIDNQKHWIIRTSALFGVNAGNGKGYNFVTRMLALAKEKGELNVVGDQWTSPTYTKDLADAIRVILDRNIPFGTYHLSGEGKTTWVNFAEGIFRNAGLSPKLSSVTTAGSGTKIRRPRMSVLRNEKLKSLGVSLPPWEDGLKRYLAELGKKSA
jgi:dTDP-4-dehydrorhamnose reductase